jgi:hypothetical protein
MQSMDGESPSGNESPVGNQTPSGWNGKTMALLVGGSVLLGAIVFSYILWLYGEVEKAATTTTAAWRAVATELAPRYAGLEKIVAEGVDSRQMAMELGEQFRLKIDSFRATGQAEQQVAAVTELEELLGKIDKSLADTPAASSSATRWKNGLRSSAELQSALESYNVRVREQKQWRSSFGGALLLAFIKLPEPREVQVVADLSNSRIQ